MEKAYSIPIFLTTHRKYCYVPLLMFFDEWFPFIQVPVNNTEEENILLHLRHTGSKLPSLILFLTKPALAIDRMNQMQLANEAGRGL